MRLESKNYFILSHPIADSHQYSAQSAGEHSSSARGLGWGKRTPCGTISFAEKTLAQFLLDRKARIADFS